MTEPNSHVDPGALGFYSDAARRIADAVSLHLTADPEGAAGRWLAFRLDDGTADPTLYDTRSDLIRAKGLFAKHWGALKILPMGISYREAESYLRTSRMIADNEQLRWKATDADSPIAATDQMLMPLNLESLRRPR